MTERLARVKKSKAAKMMTADIVNPMVPVFFAVKDNRQETHDTFSLFLAPPKGAKPVQFLPGQFNMLYLFGVGECAISISGDPANPGTLVHTVRKVGAVTKKISQLKKDDKAGVRGAFGSHWPMKKAEGKDVVIIAGGIGLAPLRPAIHHLIENRQKFGKVSLLYGARTPEDILYIKELQSWRAHFDLQVRVTVDNASSDWYGTVGVVTILISKARFEPQNTIAFVCGPEIMMRFSVLELKKCGLKTEDIYVSMERNMKCAVGFCGHCQYGPNFICKDGPVFCFKDIERIFPIREI